MTGRRRQLAIVIAGIGSTTALVLGISRAMASGQGDGAPVQYAPQVGAIPVIPGSSADVVNSLAARLPLVANARVVASAISNEDGTSTSAPVLEYDLRVPSFDGSAIQKASWEGDLLTGGVLDEFAARGFAQIAEANATLVDPSGERQLMGGGFGRVVAGQVFDEVSDSFGQQVAAAGTQFGLRDVAFSRVQGIQDAAVIVGTSDDPTTTVNELMQPSALEKLFGGSPWRFEGVYLEVRDNTGTPVFIVASAARDGSSMRWGAPSVPPVGDHVTHTPSSSQP